MDFAGRYQERMALLHCNMGQFEDFVSKAGLHAKRTEVSDGEVVDYFEKSEGGKLVGYKVDVSYCSTQCYLAPSAIAEVSGCASDAQVLIEFSP